MLLLPCRLALTAEYSCATFLEDIYTLTTAPAAMNIGNFYTLLNFYSPVIPVDGKTLTKSKLFFFKQVAIKKCVLMSLGDKLAVSLLKLSKFCNDSP